MIKVDYQNLGMPLDAEGFKEQLEKIRKTEAPSFETTKTDLTYLQEKIQKYVSYKNVILIANGGSRTSAHLFYHALPGFRNQVSFSFLTSAEPDLIAELKRKYKPEDTLVLVISKSGTNIDNIEPLLAFLDYPGLAVTEDKPNTLSQIAKIQGWDTIAHPNVGGRFSGLTTCGLVPAALMGLDPQKIVEGAQAGYAQYKADVELNENDALKLALYFAQLEKKGVTEIFFSIYSSSLFAFLPLIVQLIHESTGKDEKGMTVYGDYSPESQHHTNQRFFGGRKNVVGAFLRVENSKDDFPLEVPDKLESVEFSGHPLAILKGLSALKTLHYDMEGVVGNCREKNIPAVTISIDEVSQEAIGKLVVFWQYFTVYSAYLREQNPFDQPHVEDAKKISWGLRVNRKI